MATGRPDKFGGFGDREQFGLDSLGWTGMAVSRGLSGRFSVQPEKAPFRAG